MNITKNVPKRLAKNFPADFLDQHRHEYQKIWTIELAKNFPADFLRSLVEFAYFIQWIQPESDFYICVVGLRPKTTKFCIAPRLRPPSKPNSTWSSTLPWRSGLWWEPEVAASRHPLQSHFWKAKFWTSRQVVWRLWPRFSPWSGTLGKRIV